MTCGQPAADDGVRAVVAALDVVEVHRAAVAVRAALDLPVELRHHRVRVRAARERVAVRAVGRGEDVALLHRLADADRDGLLADRDVQEARAARRRGTAPRPSPRSAGSGASRAGSPAASPRSGRVSSRPWPRRPAVYVLRREPRRPVARVGSRVFPRAGRAFPSSSRSGIQERPRRPPRCSARQARTAPGTTLRFVVARDGSATGPDGIARLLSRIDDARIAGTLSALGSEKPIARVERDVTPLAESWDALIAELPADWSDLFAEVRLTLDRLRRARGGHVHPDEPAPCRRHARRSGSARRTTRATASSPQMARRCLERCDAADIRGSIAILHALSDTHLVATQGPVWIHDGQTI